MEVTAMNTTLLTEEFTVFNTSELCKTLGDYNRLRLLLLLSDSQERSISELVEKLKSSPSLISHQVRLLKDMRILTTRKAGKYVYCKISNNMITNILQLLILYTQKHLAKA